MLLPLLLAWTSVVILQTLCLGIKAKEGCTSNRAALELFIRHPDNPMVLVSY